MPEITMMHERSDVDGERCQRFVFVMTVYCLRFSFFEAINGPQQASNSTRPSWFMAHKLLLSSVGRVGEVQLESLDGFIDSVTSSGWSHSALREAISSVWDVSSAEAMWWIISPPRVIQIILWQFSPTDIFSFFFSFSSRTDHERNKHDECLMSAIYF